ncbi:PREDICTED: uncharacterized protein LOC105122971 isoform X1 [Populus euphratica]|uniref:Uncharacterized protein LOC105122971 isoform X1 n=1 Tax=Populus euphratica TaxID=75702 RepID=A0AAJ6XJ83_POPEU|nr:PREDICTED: uncharacterized protein LOC105122971 isoform X1 [Populus euphratica]
MEDMNSDQVFEIPDTPERAAARSINGAQFRKESISSIPGRLRKSGFVDEKSFNPPRTSRGRILSENGLNRRLHLHPQKSPINVDEYDSPSNSALDSHPHQNVPLFRRPAIVNNSRPENRHSKGVQYVEKSKAGRAANSSKKPFCMEGDDIFDLTEMSEPDRLLDIVFPHSASKDLQAKETREGQLSSNGGSSVQLAPLPSGISGSTSKGKEKIDVNTCNGSGSASNNVKEIDRASGHQHKIEKQLPACHLSVTSPRVGGKKRLVRNGCISPHNIATRAQKLAESSQDGSPGDKRNHARNKLSDGPPNTDLREIVAEGNDCYRAKGKKAIVHPSASKEHDAYMTRSSATNNEASRESRDGHRDALFGGWRSTHKRSKTQDQPLAYMEQGILGRDDHARCSTNEQHDDRLVEGDSSSGGKLHHVGNLVATHGLTSRNPGECSTMVPDDTEVLFLGSSRGSSSSRSSGVHDHQHDGNLEPIYEIDELTEVRNNDPQLIGSRSNEDSDVMARQMEADEMLARELQERLYHEEPIFGGGEIDENIAWVLQQEEDALPATSGHNHPVPHLRNSLVAHPSRQRLPRSSQNPSNRRGNQVQVTTTRASGLRSRLSNRTPVRISRERNPVPAVFPGGLNFQFPSGMDLLMRLDILENLEASMTATRMLHVQRDFNENDYEMLLALDENNSQHGASANQINCLPESVVQTDNFGETCAVCLEAPTIGEKIRHLPCLHKFHKDCIDPWLSRKTSCPICKSSITS